MMTHQNHAYRVGWARRDEFPRRNPERKDLYGMAREKRERDCRADEFAGDRDNLKFTFKISN